MSVDYDTATTSPALAVSGVSKTYRVRGRDRKTVTAVDDVSFNIPPGAAVGLVGASGSGKSTLAKMITGSERPSAGEIRYSNIVPAWERMRAGAPWPDDGQWEVLREHNTLDELGPPAPAVAGADGVLEVAFELPMPGVSYLELVPLVPRAG